MVLQLSGAIELRFAICFLCYRTKLNLIQKFCRPCSRHYRELVLVSGRGAPNCDRRHRSVAVTSVYCRPKAFSCMAYHLISTRHIPSGIIPIEASWHKNVRHYKESQVVGWRYGLINKNRIVRRIRRSRKYQTLTMRNNRYRQVDETTVPQGCSLRTIQW